MDQTTTFPSSSIAPVEILAVAKEMVDDMPIEISTNGSVRFAFTYEQGQLTECTTSSPLINHFLDVIRLSRAYNTWISYAHDLKAFFAIIAKSPETVTRADCLAFMEPQQEVGLSSPTINRRLATLSTLFKELQLLGITDQNPVQPGRAGPRPHRCSQSLYRRQAKRLPDTIEAVDLRRFFAALPTWRDRL